jgi:hypothetical protein
MRPFLVISQQVRDAQAVFAPLITLWQVASIPVVLCIVPRSDRPRRRCSVRRWTACDVMIATAEAEPAVDDIRAFQTWKRGGDTVPGDLIHKARLFEGGAAASSI